MEDDVVMEHYCNDISYLVRENERIKNQLERMELKASKLEAQVRDLQGQLQANILIEQNKKEVSSGTVQII